MHNCLTIQILRLSKGKLAKKYTSSPSHVIELSIPYYTERNNWQCNFAYLCKLSLLSLSFTIPHKQPCSLSYSVGVLLPPLKPAQQKPCMPPSKTMLKWADEKNINFNCQCKLQVLSELSILLYLLMLQSYVNFLFHSVCVTVRITINYQQQNTCFT